MKSSEFHRKIRRSKKWRFVKAEGSHYIYENKEGRYYPVPYHGAKEMDESLRKKIEKDMEL
ncbi:MAG: type II toxin-antitoxin system HicA family toxin [Prevotellaceae bacterium]|jgi:predicted RNA binding protein YcfA (HicA-like mRNA interferase family)|nr:type II toxin-antitoxin system HicA family toxin [Prevotellaceae bacterium]